MDGCFKKALIAAEIKLKCDVPEKIEYSDEMRAICNAHGLYMHEDYSPSMPLEIDTPCIVVAESTTGSHAEYWRGGTAEFKQKHPRVNAWIVIPTNDKGAQ